MERVSRLALAEGWTMREILDHLKATEGDDAPEPVDERAEFLSGLAENYQGHD
jgi:hypothetical protein